MDSKESAVLSEPPRALTDKERDRFLSQKHDNLFEAVIQLAASAHGLFDQDGCDADQSFACNEDSTAAMLLRRRKLIVAKHPTLSAQRLATRFQSMTSMVDTMCAYYDRYPEERHLDSPVREEARGVVMIATTAIQLGFHTWLADHDDTSMASLFEHFHASLDQLVSLARIYDGEREHGAPPKHNFTR